MPVSHDDRGVRSGLLLLVVCRRPEEGTMDVLRDTSTTLRLIEWPLALWFGSVFFFASAMLLLILGQQILFTCTRQAPGHGRCRLAQAGWLGTTGREIALEEVQRAAVDSGSRGTSRIVLLTTHGQVPFTLFSTSLGTGEMTAFVSRINAYL